MSSLIVEVCEVKEVRKHENADSLSVIKVKGWNCVTMLDQYKVGDLILFIPPDSIVPPDMITKYKLDYLKKNGRVRTVKLRKVISEGLVLDLPPDGNFKKGDDLAEFLGITKYEQPESKPQKGGNRVSKKKLNPMFDKYTNIENAKNYEGIFKEGEPVVITEKVHGCLEAKTKITLSNGSTKTIKDIVERKMNVSCLGLDSNGELVESKITNWFDNGKTENWVKIKYARRGFGTRGNYYGTVNCTDSHEIYSPKYKRYILAKQLKPGDTVLLTKNIDNISFIQESVLIGKMLGDGSIDAGTDHSQSISFSHKIEKEEYVDYTLMSLGNIAGKRQANLISGFGTTMARGRTQRSPAINKLFESWSNDKNKKIVPSNIRLNPISLAFWYMDDGNLGHTEVQEDRSAFAVCGFDEDSVENLVKALTNQMDIFAKKKFYDGYWRLVLNAKESLKLFTLISPYVCDCMQYKLPKEFQGKKSVLDEQITGSYQILVEKEVLAVLPLEENKNFNKTRYDIETTTHNFFANDILVHNSNWRAGYLELTIHEDQPFLYRVQKLFEKYILKRSFEFIYGSHNVQLHAKNKDSNYYGDDVWGKMAKKYNFMDIKEEDTIFYGEVYGLGIQDLTYGLNEVRLVIFDIKRDGEYITWNEVVELCAKYNLPTVPVLYIGQWNRNVADDYVGGNSILCSTQIREGCVVKPVEEKHHPTIGRKILKVINPEYLARKKGTEFK